MASYLQKLMCTTLILAMAVQISTSLIRSDDTKQYFRDICSEIYRSDACWNILKHQLRRFNQDSNNREIVNGVIHLAAAKSKEIRENLDRWFKDSKNAELKHKYHSCSKNYNGAGRSLESARMELDSDDFPKISDQIDDAGAELDKCKRVFGADSFDPAHVGNRNNELQLYLDIVRVASQSLDYEVDDGH